jgi:hypothetical protein
MGMPGESYLEPSLDNCHIEMGPARLVGKEIARRAREQALWEALGAVRRGAEKQYRMMKTAGYIVSPDRALSQDYLFALHEVRRLLEQPDRLPTGESNQSGIGLRLNGWGGLDEVVATGADVHLEQMSDNLWWLGVMKGREEVRVVLSARGRINANVEREPAPPPERMGE